VAKKVFISYRREDTGPAAGRVYDRLSRLLPKSNLFFDVNTIGGGEDFVRRIESEIERSDVALVFIGDKWLEPATTSGKSRISEPEDYVRAELRAALARSMLVLPILVAGARMPKPAQLPDDVRGVTGKNALPLRHESFDGDTESIVAAVFGVSAKDRAWDDRGTLRTKIGYGIGGAIAACAVLLVAALAHFWVLARPISASVGGPLTTLLLIAGLIGGSWLGLRYEARKRKLR
jgi:hypothetical protein